MTLRQSTKQIQRLVGFTGSDVDGIFGVNTAAAVLSRLPDAVPLKPADTNAEFDPRTESNLLSLQPGAAVRFRPFLRHAFAVAASMGVDAKVICGYRNRRDQEKAKATGASRAGWGHSWHNYGMAIDLGLFDGGSYVDGGNPRLAHRIYAAIGHLTEGYGLIWGGNWPSFPDEAHFQLGDFPVTPTSSYREQLERGDWSYQLMV